MQWSYSHSLSSQTIVCLSNGDGSALISKDSFKGQLAIYNTLPLDLCDHNYVILRTNRARCAIYKEILDLLNVESASGE